MTGAHRRDRDVKAALAGNGERGVALILSLLVLVVISLVAVILMSTLKTDNQVVSRSGGHSQALSYAEAGVEEALARIREGDIPTNGANPRMVSQIFLASAGGVPLLGSDSIALATMQPRDHWLEYSKPTKDADVLTVEYKTNADRTQIYRYDPTLASPVQTSSGVPIFTITSTGTLGTDRRRVTADVFAKPIVSSVYAALSTDVPIHLSRNFEVCGFNHRLDTASEAPATTSCTRFHVGSGDLAPEWSSKSVESSPNERGVANHASHTSGFYAGPWEALSMPAADYFSWVGTPVSALPANPRGIYYLDNDAIHQNHSAKYAIQGGDGEGFLYVDGDLAINGNFQFRGLIYVEGNLAINGKCWVLGSVIVKGDSDMKVASDKGAILYSKDAIEQNIARYGGQFVTLSWRETQ